MRRSFGIRGTFFCVMSLTLAALLLLTSYVGYRSSERIVYEKGSREAEEAVGKYGEELEGWLLEKGAVARSVAKAIEAEEARASGRSYVTPMLERLYGMTEGLVDNYVGFGDKEMYSILGTPEGYDCTARGWYQEAVEAGDVIYTEPYVDASTGEMVITIACPCYGEDGGAPVGVFALDISISYLIDLASGISVTENGYPVLIDGQGNILVHPNEDYVPSVSGEEERKTAAADLGGGYRDILPEAKAGEVGFELGADVDGAEKYFVSTRLGTAGWVLAYVLPKEDFTGALRSLLRVYGMIAIAALVIGNIVIFLALRRILRPISSMRKFADEMAEGNLSPDVSVHSRDEVGLLYDSLERSNQAIRGYIEDIRYVLGEMERGNFTARVEKEYKGDFVPIRNSLNGIAETMSRMMARIRSSSAEIAQGASAVAAEAASLAAGVSEQTVAIHELEGDIHKVIDSMEEDKENAESASGFAHEARDEIALSGRKMEELLSAMEEISAMSDEISKIVKTIDDISYQTNILSLNAAVEAARSGEVGKGFAVVASEVRTLAGRSAEAASQTSELIQKTVDAVRKGELVAKETARALSEAVEKTAQVDRYIDTIGQTVEEESSYVSEISDQLDVITDVVSRNNDSAQNSAASSEQLSGQSEVMREMVSRFRLDAGGPRRLPGGNGKAREAEALPDGRRGVPALGSGRASKRGK